MTSHREQEFKIIQKDDLPAFKDMLENTNFLEDKAFDDIFRRVIICGPINILKFLCETYPEKVIEQILIEKYNYTKSILSEFASKEIHLIPVILTTLEYKIKDYMEHNSSKNEIFKKVLDACIITICKLGYPNKEHIEEFDKKSIEVIELLKKFGGSPGEIGDPMWYTHTYDNALEKLEDRSPEFIKYMSTNINYHTCTKDGKTLFQLIVSQLSWSWNTFVPQTLKYLIETCHFDPANCGYTNGNILHRIRRCDFLTIILPILEEKKLVVEYLNQQNSDGKTPVDVHLESKEMIEMFVKYDETISDYVSRKTRKRDGKIEPGCKLWYSCSHADKKDFTGYKSTVLKFVDQNGQPVLCTWKSFPEEDGSEYPFVDKKLVGTIENGWERYGTQCIGFSESTGSGNGRCTTFIPFGPSSKNSCNRCWNKVRDLLG